MSWVSSFLQYLGLAPDEDYPEYEEYDEPVAVASPAPANNRPIRTAGPAQSAQPTDLDVSRSVGNVRPLTAEPLESAPSVVPLPSPRSVRPHLLVPSSFGQAQEVADHFKGDRPVALDLNAVDHELARRLIDFSSGLCYALGGKMEKLDHQLFLLIPAGVNVSPDDRQRIVERVAT